MSETSPQPVPNPQPEKKKSGRSIILFSVLAIIILLQGIKIYLDHQENIVQEDEKAAIDQELATTMQRLSDINEQLDQRIAQIDSLGGNIEELERAKAEIQNELSRTKRRNASAIRNLKDKADGYEILLKAKDEEIAKLKNVNSELLDENTSLKTEKNELSDSLNQLTESKEELETKVAIASHLKAEGVEIYGINSKGREREMPVKRRQIKTLKVVFNIAENEVAPIEGKDILVRIVDGNGQVIFDVAKGSGTFMLDGKEEFYTANQEILFDNSQQQLTFQYDKGSEYETGVYNLEIYTEGYKMGSKTFEIK